MTETQPILKKTWNSLLNSIEQVFQFQSMTKETYVRQYRYEFVFVSIFY